MTSRLLNQAEVLSDKTENFDWSTSICIEKFDQISHNRESIWSPIFLCWHQQAGFPLVTKWKLMIRKGNFFFLGVFCGASYLCLSSIMKQLLKEDGMQNEIRIVSLFHMKRELLFQLTFAFDFVLTQLSKRLTPPFPEFVIFFGKRAMTSKEILLMSSNAALIRQTWLFWDKKIMQK